MCFRRPARSRAQRFEVIPSGAGHDASLFANAGIPSGMLFVRNQNGSHNPHEAMDMGDFMLGVQAMHRHSPSLHEAPGDAIHHPAPS